uniref:Uncharacterized protein n=1 Tax=Brassica oleracea var. oleracea TaxID=109376 RepID=A0A0D2ZT81_BRAOL
MFSTSGAFVAYNVNPIADQFQRAFQTSTFCNRLNSFFNKRWFFDQVLNDFLVRSFLRFGYGVSYTFRRLAKRISQLQSGFVVRRVRYDPWPPAWWGAAPPLWINGKPDSTNPRKGCTAVVRASFLRFGYEVSFEALGLAKRISQLQSGFVVRRVRYDPWPPAWWGAAPPLWVNGKPDSTNPRKGCTAVVRALRPELFVVLAGMQVNESHPLASEVLTLP